MTLPPTASQFFTEYHEQVFSGQLSLAEALDVLREAYRKYPEHQNRITQMAGVVKTGIGKFPEKTSAKYKEVASILF